MKNEVIIFIDTNILLSPLKIESNIPFEELLLTLYPFKNSIVVPGHVYSEFYDNIENIFQNSKKEIEKSKEETCRSFDKIIKQLRLLGCSKISAIETQKRETLCGIEDRISNRTGLLKLDAKKLYSYFQDIFPGETDSDYSIKEKYVLMAEYDARCKRGIAPGYKDSGKDNENDYGDLFIWQEILDYMDFMSNDGVLDAVFITNDNKADWRGERSENQLQNEYSEYVFDGTFSVMSFSEFRDAYHKTIDSFRTKYNKLIKIIKKDSWSKDDFLVFMNLIKTMRLSLSFFLVMIPEELKEKLKERILPFKSEMLQLGIDFLSLSARSLAVLNNVGLTNIGKLMNCSIADMIKTRNFGKMSLSEISEKRIAFDELFGPIVSKLENYSFEGYTSRKKRVSFV